MEWADDYRRVRMRVERQAHTKMSKFKIALILLQLADLITTLYAFHLGGYEANPVVARVLPALGATGGLIFVKLAAVLIVYRLRSPRLIGFGVALMCCVVSWNALVIGLA
jgi:hypothetical protein